MAILALETRFEKHEKIMEFRPLSKWQQKTGHEDDKDDHEFILVIEYYSSRKLQQVMWESDVSCISGLKYFMVRDKTYDFKKSYLLFICPDSMLLSSLSL